MYYKIITIFTEKLIIDMGAINNWCTETKKWKKTKNDTDYDIYVVPRPTKDELRGFFRQSVLRVLPRKQKKIFKKNGFISDKSENYIINNKQK